MTYQVRIYFKSFDNLYIETSVPKILQISTYLKKVGQQNLEKMERKAEVVSLPTVKKKFTVLRSPHIDKKSREQFEWKRYKKSIFLNFQKIGTLSLFLFLLKNESFPGVQVELNLKDSTFYRNF